MRTIPKRSRAPTNPMKCPGCGRTYKLKGSFDKHGASCGHLHRKRLMTMLPREV
jgi:hypothetical protein